MIRGQRHSQISLDGTTFVVMLDHGIARRLLLNVAVLPLISLFCFLDDLIVELTSCSRSFITVDRGSTAENLESFLAILSLFAV